MKMYKYIFSHKNENEIKNLYYLSKNKKVRRMTTYLFRNKRVEVVTLTEYIILY